MNKTSVILFFAILSVALGNACSGTSNVDVSNGGANGNTAVATLDASTPGPPVDVRADTPTAAYETAFNARNNKDIEALKRLLSKDVLQFFAEMQKTDNRTLDDVLKELTKQSQAPKAEVRNEKIEGDTAWLEYKDENGGWQRMDFIKEDGIWKLTIPKAELREPQAPADQKKG